MIAPKECNESADQLVSLPSRKKYQIGRPSGLITNLTAQKNTRLENCWCAD